MSPEKLGDNRATQVTALNKVADFPLKQTAVFPK